MDHKVSQEELDRIADLFNHEHVEVKKEQGILNNLELHFENECARHKLLDVVGDLSLAGVRIKGKIIASKPGHKVNTEFAKILKKEYDKQNKSNEIPVYDPKQEPLMDVNRLRTFLPHRFPFLLVDKVVDIKDDYIVGIKNVSVNEPFFQGHFPEEPVMPGVLIVEAMAQCGGLYVLHDKEEKYSTYFIRIDNVKFRKKVVPGDTLVLKIRLTSPIRRGIANMKGLCYVGDKVVAEGDFMAQIVKV
jgi:UDP-3-O-[3-hydroxymyristoyl] N-acetylglucosamine deacetylase/3-hydroxyacyl-[acyl-carrier-protein] dehydratase